MPKVIGEALARDELKQYAKSIREQRQAQPTNIEQALAPSFQRLLERLLSILAPNGLIVVPEFAQPGIGRPDIAIKRVGQPARAFVELKAPEKPDDPRRFRDPHDKAQFERFKTLPVWAISNFTHLRLFQRDTEIAQVQLVPSSAVDPTASDARANRAIDRHDISALSTILTPLAFADPPPAPNAQALAGNLAHAARLIRSIIADRLAELSGTPDIPSPLIDVRQEFRDVLYAHPQAAGYNAERFDPLFAAAFAQTLAFGLLLAREASGQMVNQNAWQIMPEQHVLMRTTLRVLSQEEILKEIGIGFDVITDCVNSFDPAIIVQEDGKPDPILYFYEDFLAVFDPAARQRYGVFYTPLEVVSFMVGALDRVLREDLALSGLADPRVTLLDPAVGTGTFLIAIVHRVRADVERQSGQGMVAAALKNLTERLFGFECLVGPYAVAHYRLNHALGSSRNDKRVGIYLADTLAEPGSAAPTGRLGFVAENILAERRKADHVKNAHPIFAIIGNPPYRRLAAGEVGELVGDWMNDLWDDLKAPVRDAGWGNQLNTFPELSVAFWRWAIWKMFESENAPKRGVIALITNRTFLAGKPYAGLRAMLREKFDRIEIIDLRGDLRRGERADIEGDQGVFNIQVGTAITLAIATGQKPPDAMAEIYYTDTWEREVFSRESKLDWLKQGIESGTREGAIRIERDRLDPFKPVPFQRFEWVSLNQIFIESSSGIETARDDLVYGTTMTDVEVKIQRFLSTNNETVNNLFNPTHRRGLQSAKNRTYDPSMIAPISYRPLEIRQLYFDTAFIEWDRRELRNVWGEKNLALFSMPSATNKGPATWCHGLLPDRHAFRGSFGGYAFPLRDNRPGRGPFNIASSILAGLSLAYGETVAAEDAFDAILCLLSATSYTTRFAEDLEDDFPHIPFPADKAVFREAVAIGRDIRAVETFARPPASAFFTASIARVETEPLAPLNPSDWSEGTIKLCADGSGRISGIAREIWDFEVSGYRVVSRWLNGRGGQAIDHALLTAFRDLIGRVGELISLFQKADLVLIRALESTLSKRMF